ncbi:MAG: UDP-N-acetylglucosamine transferase subunit ALG14 [Caldilineales bacterium]|nr:UDP-N-acetylglucosamine transferase subunit ALG14 [Caldilineales bacterium]MDW8316433.1 PssD/Cps14F family polysaccharide biosynthesis glycosyltransferase [Anaerolineae bacterium]
MLSQRPATDPLTHVEHPATSPRPRLRVLVVLGEGGHTRQMLTLLDQLGPQYDYHYLMADQDRLSEAQIRLPGPVYRVRRPRTKVEGRTDPLPVALLQTLRSLFEVWPLLRRIRPDVVLANGPSVAVPVVLLGKLAGARVIWLETASRVYSLSASARIVYPLADLFIVQWPQLRQRYPKAVYAGRLL